jgi:folate-binding protein YgfZ
MTTVVVDQSPWGQLRVTGADRVRFLQGMVTNDVAVLGRGGWCRAALLNVKGRVLAIVDVVAEEDAFVVLTEPATADKVLALLEAHAIADDVAFTREARPLHRVWPSPAAVWSAPPVFAPPESPSSPEAVEIRRVEGGLPRYGVDVSEEHFPFEANLQNAISYTKGCYTGQEVVARASARGHANKRLCGLRLAAPVPVGAAVAAEIRPEAGVVTSAVVSPELGPIALAYLHRTVWVPGFTVEVGGVGAVVVELPFSAG